MPAFVRTFGKTRQRETVILPTCADGRKLPIIFLFHGKSQLKVIVPAGRPCLVLFTKTAMINGDVLKHILERAVFPNLPREIPPMLLDDHFLEAVVAWLAQNNTQAVKIEHPLTKCVLNSLACACLPLHLASAVRDVGQICSAA
jgi:hypothetical protein